MISARPLARRALVVATIALAGASILGLVIQRSEFAAIEKISKGSVQWSTMELENELNKFLVALGRFGVGDSEVTSDDVIDRFDILWSRAIVAAKGKPGERIARFDEHGAVGGLTTTLAENEATVMALERGARPEIISLLTAFRFHQPRLRELSVAVNIGEATLRWEQRVQLSRTQLVTSILAVAAILAAGVIVSVTRLDSRRSRLTAERHAVMARELEMANEAKSRFLTMMSHELRTPMNGVLGQLALAKLPGLPQAQLRLIEDAERSGRRLVSMLVDILDFTALQSRELAIEAGRFEPTNLVRPILDACADHGGGRLRESQVDVSVRARRPLMGDEARIRQALCHLTAYVAETAGAGGLRLALDYAEGELRAILSFYYDEQTSGAWRPTLLLGEAAGGGQQFATAALGPAIARALIEAMGGRVELTALYAGQTSVTISIPAAAVEETRPRVLLHTGSETMRLVCEAVLRGASVDLVSESAAEVDVILLEAGGGDEAARLSALKSEHPSARAIALGRPAEPMLFDEVATLPLEVNALCEILHGDEGQAARGKAKADIFA